MYSYRPVECFGVKVGSGIFYITTKCIKCLENELICVFVDFHAWCVMSTWIVLARNLSRWDICTGFTSDAGLILPIKWSSPFRMSSSSAELGSDRSTLADTGMGLVRNVLWSDSIWWIWRNLVHLNYVSRHIKMYSFNYFVLLSSFSSIERCRENPPNCEYTEGSTVFLTVWKSSKSTFGIFLDSGCRQEPCERHPPFQQSENVENVARTSMGRKCLDSRWKSIRVVQAQTGLEGPLNPVNPTAEAAFWCRFLY